MLGEIRRSYRNLARRPAFFLAVVLTLTLGIGANSAIFSVIDAVLLKPLPYPGGDRLMALFESNTRQKVERQPVAPVRLEEWNRMAQSFTGMTGAYTESFAEISGTLPEKLVSARVATRFFPVLGTPLLLGRGFTADEERATGPQAIVISERFWERRFARDSGVLGKTLRAGRAAYPIVGVAPDSFRFPAADVDVWLPAKLPDAVMRTRDARFYTSVRRLKEGVAESQARADLAAVQGRLAMEYPASDANWTSVIEPLKENTVGGVRRSLWILFGAVSLVRAIACTNVACLLLAQASQREREIAVRFSLGASRKRVIGQLLLESLCSAAPGAALGLAAAVFGADSFRRAAANLPRADEIQLDWRIVAFTVTITLVTAVLFGLVPAPAATRDAAGGLAGGRGRSADGRGCSAAW